MIFDSHSHTEFSADSSMTAEQALTKAKALGIGLVFTEHLDIGFPSDNPFGLDAAAYFAAYTKLRGDNLRLGIEVGLTSVCRAENLAFIAQGEFDQVIGSLHLLHGRDLYQPKTYAGKDKEVVYRDYLRSMAEEVRRHDYIDVSGHIDYICRYAPYENSELDYATYRDEIDAVLQAVLDTGAVMELNTRRLGSEQAAESLLPIYKRYAELGGRYVTLGSDAHTAEAVGGSFAAAQKIVAACNLQVVTFCCRKPEIC